MTPRRLHILAVVGIVIAVPAILLLTAHRSAPPPTSPPNYAVQTGVWPIDRLNLFEHACEGQSTPATCYAVAQCAQAARLSAYSAASEYQDAMIQRPGATGSNPPDWIVQGETTGC